MAVRTQAQLETLYADNTAGDISAEDLRDGVIDSVWTPGWVQYLDHRMPDETGTDDDDFFTDGTVPGTAIAITGTATWVEEYGRLGVIADDQAANDIAGRSVALTSPSAPLTVETRVTPAMMLGSTIQTGIGFVDGNTASDDIVYAAAFSTNTNPSRGWRVRVGTLTNSIATTNTTVGVDSAGGEDGAANRPLYLRAIWVSANTFKVGFSPNGLNWTYSANVTPTFTPVSAILVATTDGGTDPIYVSYDYLRVTAADLSA